MKSTLFLSAMLLLIWISEPRSLRGHSQRKHEGKTKAKARLLPDEYLTETPVFHSQVPILFNNTRHPFVANPTFTSGPPNFQPSNEASAFASKFSAKTAPELGKQNANSIPNVLNTYNTRMATGYLKNDKIMSPVYFQPVSLQNRNDKNEKLLDVPDEANIVNRENNDRLGASARDYNDYYSKYFQKYYMKLGEDPNNPIKSFDDSGAVFSNPQLKNIYKYIPMIYAQNYNEKLLDLNTSIYETKKRRKILKDPNNGCNCLSKISEICDCDETDNREILRAPTLVMPILQPIIQQVPEPDCNSTCIEEYEDCYCPAKNESDCAPPAPPVDDCGKPRCKCPCTPKQIPASRNTLEHRTVVNNINQLEHNSYMFNFDPGTRFKEKSFPAKKAVGGRARPFARFQSLEQGNAQLKEKMASAKAVPLPAITITTDLSDQLIDQMAADKSNLTMINKIPKEVLGRVVDQDTYSGLEKDLAEQESFTMAMNGALNETLHSVQRKKQKDILKIGGLPPEKEPKEKKLILLDVKKEDAN